MAAYYRCPKCQAVLRKSPVDAAMSKAAGGVLVTRGGSSVYCPVCKFVMSREDIWAGKYDVNDRKWWQFWKKDVPDVLNAANVSDARERESVSHGPASESPAAAKSESPTITKSRAPATSENESPSATKTHSPAISEGTGDKDGLVDDRLKVLIAGLIGAGHTRDEIVPEARFIKDLGFDSLDCVELIMAVEEEFGTVIPDKDAARIETVGQAAAYIAAPPEDRESLDSADEIEFANGEAAPAVRGSDTLVPMRDYGTYLGNLAKRLDTPNPDTLYAHHEAFCAQCGIQFTREALVHLHLFGSGDFANLTVIGATKAGDDIRSGRCPRCGSTTMRIVAK